MWRWIHSLGDYFINYINVHNYAVQLKLILNNIKCKKIKNKMITAALRMDCSVARQETGKYIGWLLQWTMWKLMPRIRIIILVDRK